MIGTSKREKWTARIVMTSLMGAMIAIPIGIVIDSGKVALIGGVLIMVALLGIGVELMWEAWKE